MIVYSGTPYQNFSLQTAVKFASSPDLVSWSMEEEMEQIDLSLLTEKDIFVFGEFRGQLFDKLVSLIKP